MTDAEKIELRLYLEQPTDRTVIDAQNYSLWREATAALLDENEKLRAELIRLQEIVSEADYQSIEEILK